MKYDQKIVQKISDEIQKIPNVRHVCLKVGIDHSTFYRWMSKHHSFFKEVHGALVIGREKMNDAAESVIMNGVQNGDYKCATYWLSHNSDRYVSVERAPYHQHLEKNMLNLLKASDVKSVFEVTFKHYSLLEDVKGKEEAKKSISPIVEYMCQDDPNLVDIFYATYREWKIETDDGLVKRKKMLELVPEEDEDS